MNTKSRDQTNGEIYTAKTKAFKCATQAACLPKGASVGTLLIADQFIVCQILFNRSFDYNLSYKSIGLHMHLS